MEELNKKAADLLEHFRNSVQGEHTQAVEALQKELDSNRDKRQKLVDMQNELARQQQLLSTAIKSADAQYQLIYEKLQCHRNHIYLNEIELYKALQLSVPLSLKQVSACFAVHRLNYDTLGPPPADEDVYQQIPVRFLESYATLAVYMKGTPLDIKDNSGSGFAFWYTCGKVECQFCRNQDFPSSCGVCEARGALCKCHDVILPPPPELPVAVVPMDAQ